MITNTPTNLHRILQKDPKLKDAIAFNEFSLRIAIRGSLPWHKLRNPVAGGTWGDADLARMQQYLEKNSRKFTENMVKSQLLDVATTHSFHPIREYLESVRWDGVPRVDTVLIDKLGAEDTEYTRAVTRKVLCAAVARVMTPGCKFDYVLMLAGPQGLGKSTFIRDIAHNEGWFSESVRGIGTKEAVEQLQGVWIAEMAELTAFRKSDTESIRNFITQRADSCRMAYAQYRTDMPRQCIFIGTTNSAAFLKDETGNRRFWPMWVTRKYMGTDRQMCSEEVDQLWAEAVQLWRAGETLYLPPALEAEARIQQACFELDDPWLAQIEDYLDKPIPTDWYSRSEAEKQAWLSAEFEGDDQGGEELIQRDVVTLTELWTEALGGAARDVRRNTAALQALMQNLPEWEWQGNRKVRIGPKVARAYTRVRA